MIKTFVPFNDRGVTKTEDPRVMKYVPVAPHIMAQCGRFIVRKDLIGGALKAGTLVYGLKRIKIFVPEPILVPDEAKTVSFVQDPPEKVAEINVDGQTFDDYFKPANKDDRGNLTPIQPEGNEPLVVADNGDE